VSTLKGGVLLSFFQGLAMGNSFLFQRRVDSAIAGLEEAKNPAAKSAPPDSDFFNDMGLYVMGL
jgi:hypothetical protein